MSEETEADSADVTYFGLSKQQILFEFGRASYAVGIGTAMTTILVFGVALLEVELPDTVVFTVFLIGFGLVPAGLYVYDRSHDRDFVIADFGHAIVRPIAVLYRILRAP